MTGRELIIYILKNGLEDEPVINDGKFIGFMTISEAAAKFEVGIATVCVWLKQGSLSGFTIGRSVYIPADSKRPFEKFEFDDPNNPLNNPN